MLKLSDILDTEKLAMMVGMKRINVQSHPTLPLYIYNYSNMAQFAGEWSHEERVCRGLIVDADDNVIARGPSKFFNYGQTGAPEVKMGDLVQVSRKEDGSLGIWWEYMGLHGVATRGSFASDQAIHASIMLTDDDKANIDWAKERELTRISEIVYSANRIVLDYGDRDELIPLGTVENRTGLIDYRPKSVLSLNGSLIRFEDAVKLPIPDNEEGYVIDVVKLKDGHLKIDSHLKLKGENYVRLHGAIFGLSERKIWEAFGDSVDGMNSFIAGLPDELQPWAIGVSDRLEDEFNDLFDSIMLRYAEIEMRVDGSLTDQPRGDVAHMFMEYPTIKGPLFSLLDGNTDAVEEWAYKQIKPEHKLFRVDSQDTN